MLRWCIIITVFQWGPKKYQMMIPSPTQNKCHISTKRVKDPTWTWKVLDVYRTQRFREERGTLVVIVLFSSRSRTLTALLWTQQVGFLPCHQSPDRKPPRQSDSTMPADNKKTFCLWTFSHMYEPWVAFVHCVYVGIFCHRSECKVVVMKLTR